MPIIAVDFGYTEIPVAQLAPDKIISHFNALPDSIADVLAARGVPTGAADAAPGKT